MRISERVQELKLSPIRKLAPYADAAKKAGKKVYHLNIGQPDIETPSQFMDAIKNYHDKVIAYGNSKGEPFLIEAIQKYYAEKGMNYEAGDIYITNGGSEALTFTVMALCDPDDEIMVFEPFYANYTTFATEFGAKINAVTTSVKNGYHLPVKHDLAVIADEVYREFVYDGEYKSFGTMPELDENLIIIDSVSKRYSACGARIGCIISKNKDFCQQINKCCQGRLCGPILEQVGAAALYTTPVSYLEAVNKEYQKRRDTIAAGLKSLPGVEASDPKGAFYVMVKFPVDDAEKFAIWLLENFDVDGETVMFAPGNGFYSTPGLGVNEARLAYVLNCDDLKRAIYILGEALKAYPGRTC